ncbi:MAG: phosphopantothenate--cysteine ligase [Clostridiales Family XIII bacterium]|jgi:phosphopantothenate-cysteine ligase|nr:phosphopantothenate--cysteine ligase [Clostridiales Family XIII bacterium]
MKKLTVLITSGGTSEKIDDVRRITNSGTGRLGALIADTFAEEDASLDLHYVCSENAVRPHSKKAIVHTVDGVRELLGAVTDLSVSVGGFDIIIHSMAVGDYTVAAVSDEKLMSEDILGRILSDGDSNEPSSVISTGLLNPPKLLDKKISSDKENIIVVLEKAPKVIGTLRPLNPDAVIVGFKLLAGVSDEELIAVGGKLLAKNDCNFVLANDMTTVRTDAHAGILIGKDGKTEKAVGKTHIAELIVARTLAEV